MSDPKNQAEYDERFMRNHAITGHGITGVEQHMPCPFCAAPDWSVFKVIDAQEAMAKARTCKQCGRSCRVVITIDDNGKSFEFVQTGGPAQPDYLPPMRRVDIEEAK